jgi:hypothetical protein
VTDVDLTADIQTAREAIKPKIDRLLGLLQMWHMFQTAKVVADEFHIKYDDLSFPLRIACTRSLATDYMKAWSGNQSPEINALKVFNAANRWSYPFLDSISAKSEHEQLRELRNKIVAHLDRDYEGGGVTLKGTRIENVPANRPQDEGTLDNVFLPTLAVMAGRRGLWWLSDKGKIAELCEHINEAKALVEGEIRNAANEFRLGCIDHMHVVGLLPDLFATVNTPIEAGNVKVDPFTVSPVPLSTSDPVELLIGDQRIQSLATVYEPRPEYPTNVEIRGKGYSLTIGEMSGDGQLTFNVSFPKYPHPKGH